MKAPMQTEHIELSFPSDLLYESIARDVVNTFAHALGFEAERVADITTAVGEAYTNATEHGNMLNSTLRIDIQCTYVDHCLTIEVRDQGAQQFTGDRRVFSMQEKVAGMGSTRGMGLLLMELLADETHISTDANGGNCLQMAWYRKPSPLQQAS